MKKGRRKEFDHDHRCVWGSGWCLYCFWSVYGCCVVGVMWCFGWTFVVLGMFFPLFLYIYICFVIIFIHWNDSYAFRMNFRCFVVSALAFLSFSIFSFTFVKTSAIVLTLVALIIISFYNRWVLSFRQR